MKKVVYVSLYLLLSLFYWYSLLIPLFLFYLNYLTYHLISTCFCMWVYGGSELWGITYEPNKPDQDRELQHLQERINMQDDNQD